MNIKYVMSSISTAATVALLSASTAAFAADDGQAHSDSALAAVSDTSITATVKAKYLEDTRLKNSDISVATVNGVVTLTGSATGDMASNAAKDLARHVSGVTEVDNHLVTPMETPPVSTRIEDKTRSAGRATARIATDSWITTKVKSALLADSVTKGFKISVSTRHHVVVLAGALDTRASIDEAVHLAAKVKGVDTVDSSALRIAAN